MNKQFDKLKPNWIHGQYFNGELWDKTNPFPWGAQLVKRPYRHLVTIGGNPSSWTDFPKKYKITGYQINIFDSKTITTRKTLTALDVFGAVGGLIGIISLFVGAFVARFSAPQFSSFVANRLYSWEIPKSWKN